MIIYKFTEPHSIQTQFSGVPVFCNYILDRRFNNDDPVLKEIYYSLRNSHRIHLEVGCLIYMQKPVRRIISLNVLDLQYLDAIKLKKKRDAGLLDNYFLSFPYILFKVNFFKYKDRFFIGDYPLELAFATEESANTIYLPPLPNISMPTEGRPQVCLGNSFYDKNYEGTVSEEALCKNVIQSFWASTFNSGLSGALMFYSNHKYAADAQTSIGSLDFCEWEKRTKENPQWIPTEKELIEVSKEKFFSFSMDN